MGFGAGVNFYTYARDSPSNFKDPSGLYYTVTQSGDTITVSANLAMYGEKASADLAQAWQNEINELWSNFGGGWQYEGCKVKFDARITAFPNARSYLDFAADWDGLIDAVDRPESFRSRTVLGYLGVWGAQESGIAQEFGHMLELSDQYRDYWHGIRVPNGLGNISEPIPGHENDIMGTRPDSLLSRMLIKSSLVERAGVRNENVVALSGTDLNPKC